MTTLNSSRCFHPEFDIPVVPPDGCALNKLIPSEGQSRELRPILLLARSPRATPGSLSPAEALHELPAHRHHPTWDPTPPFSTSSCPNLPPPHFNIVLQHLDLEQYKNSLILAWSSRQPHFLIAMKYQVAYHLWQGLTQLDLHILALLLYIYFRGQGRTETLPCLLIFHAQEEQQGTIPLCREGAKLY